MSGAGSLGGRGLGIGRSSLGTSSRRPASTRSRCRPPPASWGRRHAGVGGGCIAGSPAARARSCRVSWSGWLTAGSG